MWLRGPDANCEQDGEEKWNIGAHLEGRRLERGGRVTAFAGFGRLGVSRLEYSYAAKGNNFVGARCDASPRRR